MSSPVNLSRHSGAFLLSFALSLAAAFTAGCPAAAQNASGSAYVIRFDHWSDADERDFGEFLAGIGRSGCTTVNACLHDPSNPFQASDPPNVYFRSDCANLPYVLRAYFAWKRGLPFSYESGVAPLGGASDDRYSPNGNRVTARTDVLTGSTSGYALLNKLLGATSSASYRIGPHADTPPLADFYSTSIDAKAIHPGTVIYDPNGHLALIFSVERDGRIQYIDSHPDNTLTRGYYDLRFVRANPGAGAGFKNWRPLRLAGYSRRADGALVGGRIELPRNEEIPTYSDEQYYGNGPRVADANWASGTFVLNGETLDYYDYVRAKVGGGKLQFDPVKEVAEQVDSNCADLHYRAQAVDIATTAGIQNRPEPDRLPRNIYGTSGDWETYSTPSRDARLKTAFKELRDKAQRFVQMYENGDTKHLLYTGRNLVDDMLAAYDREVGQCSVTYRRTNGASVALSYEDARKRLFLISFDPYQCIERRWGATDAEEMSSCHDSEVKRAWYEAEQNLRNQIDRTYDARMDFTLADLRTPGLGKGVPQPPDIDARAYLLSIRGQVVQRPQSVAEAEPTSPAELVGVAASKPDFDLASWKRERESQYAAWEQSRGGQRFAGPYYNDPRSRSGVSNAAIWDVPDAPQMMAISAGSFVMGSPPGERGRKAAEGPQHTVRIARSLALSRDLVTFDEWNACAAEGGCRSYFPNDEHWGRGTRPVINVSWNDAQDYITWLGEKTGHRYRLPTEAEWEYAARAGTTTPYYTGYSLTTDQANYDGVDYPGAGSSGTYRQTTTPVGTFAPNGFGLTDMGGNVWEWIEDCWNADYRGAPNDGSAWARGDCNRRIVRAGAFNNTPAFARSAFRFWEVGQLRSAFVGFRVARDL
jgi:formylglycine-generating enzyme required for sulfatase activity